MATELTTDRNNFEAQSISEMLGHGSVSFGRFAAESLAWEKWSVFSHNRCQEELERFKAPGLVAQKKAYFEEYYKRIRALKVLQAEQQESLGSDTVQDTDHCCQTDKDEPNINQLHNKADIKISEEGKHESDTHEAQFLETESAMFCGDSSGENSKDERGEGTEKLRFESNNDDGPVSAGNELGLSESTVVPECSLREKAPESTISHPVSFGELSKDEMEEDTKQLRFDCNNGEKVNVEKAHEVSVSAVVPKVSPRVKASESMVSTHTSLEDAPQGDIVSDKVKLNVKNHASAPKAKEAAASVRDNAKVDYRSKAVPSIPSERPKGLCKETNQKADNSIVLRKTSNIRAVSNKHNTFPSHRPCTKVRPNVTVSRPAAATETHISMSSSSRSGLAKGHFICKDSTKKLPSRLPVHAKNQLSVQEAAASVRDNAKVDYRSKAVPSIPSERPKGLCKETNQKADDSIVLRKTSNIRAVSNMHNTFPSQRPRTKVCPNVIVSRPPAATETHISMPSSSRSGLAKGHFICKDSTNKLPSRLPIHARNPLSVQRDLKEIAGTGGLRNTPLESKRAREAVLKSSDMGSSTMPKGRVLLHQGSKAMFTNNTSQNKSIPNNGIEFGPSISMRQGRQKGREEISIRELGRGSKFSSSMSSRINRSQNSKTENKKIARSPPRFVDLLHERRERRRGMPVWR